MYGTGGERLIAEDGGRCVPVPAGYQGHVVRQPFPTVFELEEQHLFGFIQRDGRCERSRKLRISVTQLENET